MKKLILISTLLLFVSTTAFSTNVVNTKHKKEHVKKPKAKKVKKAHKFHLFHKKPVAK